MKTKRIAITLLCLFMCVVMGGEALLSAFSIQTSAADSVVEYTNAYNDLLLDPSFNVDEYTAVSKSDPKYYSLEVITIAESENGELFVYVYQPGAASADVRAVSIDISTLVRTGDRFRNYKLEYINNYGVFYKYKVVGLVVSSEQIRYYEISDILRPWSESYGDEKPGGDNTISEVPFAVGKQFTVKTSENGSTSITMEDVDYISITEKYVGYIRYEQDDIFPDYIENGGTDAHFVAFSTDRKIDTLREADVYYESQVYHAYKDGLSFSTDPWKEIAERYMYLDYEREAECEISDGSIFVQSPHIWKRIQKTSDFLSQDVPLYIFPGFSVSDNIEFTDTAKTELAKTQWVLSFAETEYTWWTHVDLVNGSNGNYTHKYTRVGNVKILRLKFATDDKVYDLGVVDNKQTGSKDPSAVVRERNWWEFVIALLMLIVLLCILSNLWTPLAVFLAIIWNVIKLIFRVLWWVIGLPFSLIDTLMRRRSGSGRNKRGGANGKKNN